MLMHLLNFLNDTNTVSLLHSVSANCKKEAYLYIAGSEFGVFAASNK